jgi:hypothetical protein
LRTGISTENAAFKLTDSVLISINQEMHAGALLCELAKAFGCVNHKILLTNLHFLGIQETMASWFRSYLTENKRSK